MTEAGERSSRAATVLRALAVGALAVPFVLNVDAQWLKADDFWMIETFRATPLRRLVPDILLTRTTPHVRFAFLEHLLFIPFYREGVFHRAAVNALFLASAAALACAGLALARPLRRNGLAWLGGWVLFAAAVLHVRGWNTLEFKTALYLPLGFALTTALVAYTATLLDDPAPAGRVRLLAWAALAMTSFHMSEVSLFAVAAAGAALVLARRASPWIPGAVILWPLAYWALNKIIVPRPIGLEMGLQDSLLYPALTHSARHLMGAFRVEAALCAAALAFAAALTVARPRPGAVPALLLAAALPASGLGLLVLTQMNSAGANVPGYLSDRHAFFTQLCLVGGALAAASVVVRLGDRVARGLAAAALLVVGGVQLWQRTPALFAYADARRVELERTFAVRDALRARAREHLGSARELLVFVADWPGATIDGVFVDATFIGPFSRDSFGSLFVCGEPGCPSIRFFPNTGWYRTPLAERQRTELCQRLEKADAVIVGAGGAVLPAPTARTAGACAAWVADLRLVDPVDATPR